MEEAARPLIAPLIRIGALKLGGGFITALTKRRGTIIDRYEHRTAVLVEFEDGSTLNLHCDVRVRPMETIH